MRFIARGKASDIVIMVYSSMKLHFNKVRINDYEKEVLGWKDLDRLSKWHNTYSVWNCFIDKDTLILEEEYHHEKEFKVVVEVLM